jgi:CRISPR type IV-associated protein Csf3
MALPLHLDALLAYAVTQEALQDAKYNDEIPTGMLRQLGEQLPLVKVERGDLWCWQASALIPEAVLEHEMRMWTRKTESELMATMTQEGAIARTREPKFPLKPFSLKIDTQRGLLKNHFQFIPVRHVRKFVAFCVGDADRIENLLLTHITHIGARKRAGFGRIALQSGGNIQAISVTQDDQARTLWQQRILPWQDEGTVPIQAAHKAPYWAPENRAISFIPAHILA